MIKVPNADECAKLCQAYEPCLAVTYIPASGICVIKNAVPNQTSNAQVISAIKIPAK
jgi:hypothetical protein